jgi:hypothetical protein
MREATLPDPRRSARALRGPSGVTVVMAEGTMRRDTPPPGVLPISWTDKRTTQITSEPITSEPITSEPITSEPITPEPFTSKPFMSL